MIAFGGRIWGGEIWAAVWSRTVAGLGTKFDGLGGVDGDTRPSLRARAGSPKRE